jgi:predicted SprT family Zn-dependent metalloprotease
VNTKEIVDLTKYCLDECGVDIPFEVIYNSKYVKKIATATVQGLAFPGFRRGIVQISTRWWDKLDLAEKENTVVHEACHLASFVLDYKRVVREGRKGHGEFWAALHLKCGRPPRRYCSAPPEVEIEGTYTLQCSKCGQKYPRTTKTLITRRLNKGTGSCIGTCRVCKAKIYPPKEYIRDMSDYQFSSMFDIHRGSSYHTELLTIRNA